jgi:cathepsin L
VPSIEISNKGNCSSGYAFTTLSAAEDRICTSSGEKVKLAAQEILDCDVNNFGCTGGYVNKVLQFGRSKGYVLEECMEYTGATSECDVDHFESNDCRIANQVFKVQD